MPDAEISDLSFVQLSHSFAFQIFKEFTRATKNDCLDKFQKFWTQARIATVLKMAKKKAETEQLVSQIAEVSTVDVARRLFIDLVALETITTLT